MLKAQGTNKEGETGTTDMSETTDAVKVQGEMSGHRFAEKRQV